MTRQLLLMTGDTADAIEKSGTSWGHLGLALNGPEEIYHVVTWSKKRERNFVATEGWSAHDAGRSFKGGDGQGLWYRGTTDLHDRGYSDSIRGRATSVSFMQEQVGGDWLTFKRVLLIVTFCDRGGRIEWAAWLRLGEDVFVPIDIEIFDPEVDLLAPLGGAWPREALAENLVTVVGLGSIGGAACEAMAAYGVQKLALIDDDRLSAKNFARHRATRRHHGKHKVDSAAEMMRERDTSIEVEPIRANVAYDADKIRPLIKESALVACFTDGPESRRVVNHLAFWARRPAVFGCALDLGSYGETLVLLPGKTGCLECNRVSLGESMEIERGLEYAELQERLEPAPGRHFGMSRAESHYGVDPGVIGTTAVGADLHLVGQISAKAAVATLLTRAGFREQQLPGSHALIGLRPSVIPDPEPFGRVGRVGEVAWLPTASPRLKCRTCGEAA
jgi:molybdopterin/thiamine biosynthesis adenylyltransferase